MFSPLNKKYELKLHHIDRIFIPGFIGIHGLLYLVGDSYSSNPEFQRQIFKGKINKRKYLWYRQRFSFHPIVEYLYHGEYPNLRAAFTVRQNYIDNLGLKIYDIGYPNRKIMFQKSWRNDTTVPLAIGIKAEKAFDRMPILADALEEAGMDHGGLLNHLRTSKVFTPESKVLAWLTKSELWI